MATKRSTAGGGPEFSGLLKRLVRVPIEELRAEERKYEAAKKRRQAKAAKKKP
jgi:hypothetical protein